MITDRYRRAPPWRAALWSAALLLLTLPWVAMLFADEVNWDLADFVWFGGMLLIACGLFELAARLISNRLYLWTVGLAIALSFLLVWAELAVGVFS